MNAVNAAMARSSMQDGDAPLALTALDRCDRCGAQAYVRVALGSGSELLFCNHHWHDNEARLRELAVAVHDETDRLSTTPGIAALDER